MPLFNQSGTGGAENARLDVSAIVVAGAAASAVHGTREGDPGGSQVSMCNLGAACTVDPAAHTCMAYEPLPEVALPAGGRNGHSYAAVTAPMARLRELTYNMNMMEAENEMFFELSPDLLVIAAPGGHFIKLSASWTSVLGWDLAELMEMSWPDLVHPEDRETLMDLGCPLHASRSLTTVNRFRCKDGSYKTLQWRISGFDKHNRAYGAARCVSEGTASVSALSYYDGLPVGIIQLTGDTVTAVNTAWCEMLGQPAGATTSLAVRRRAVDADTLRALLCMRDRALSGAAPLPVETLVVFSAAGKRCFYVWSQLTAAGTTDVPVTLFVLGRAPQGCADAAARNIA